MVGRLALNGKGKSNGNGAHKTLHGRTHNGAQMLWTVPIFTTKEIDRAMYVFRMSILACTLKCILNLLGFQAYGLAALKDLKT